MKFHSFLVLAAIILFFSCNQPATCVEDDSKFVVIKSPREIKDIKLGKYSEVFDSVKMVKLETTASSLIGRVDKILYLNDHIFILDQIQSKAVFEFDTTGKFIRRYGKTGDGIGEYNEPNDMSINGKELTIWVNDLTKFIVFDMDGKYKREFKTATTAKSGVMIGDSRFALYTDIGIDMETKGDFNLKIYDGNGKADYEAFESNGKYYSKGSFFFSQNQNRFLISPSYSNNIYELYPKGNVVSKKYEIDFGEYIIPDGFAEKQGTPMAFHKALARSKYAYLDNYWETDDCLVYTFVYKGKIYDAYYSKKSKETRYGSTWFNDINGFFTGVNKGVNGDYVIAIYDPSNVESVQKAYKFPPSPQQRDTLAASANRYFEAISKKEVFVASDFDYSKEEIDLLQSIKSSDNPVILIQKLKTF